MPTVLNPTSEETRIYEIAVLISADLTDKEKQETLRNIETLFTERGMKVREKDEWRKMGLAYSIKGKTQGQYIIFYVEGKAAAISELDRQMKIERGILRHLTIKLPPNYEVVNWEDHYNSWKEGLVKEEEDIKKEKEEVLKKKIIQRATKKEAKEEKVATKGEEKKEIQEVSEKEITEKLGELISDEGLNL
ncbi:30S ribosomal protein S6 [Candidatus Kaiserbacteria bacterium RIFCSPLOWO2_12_FULL_53_8]|uniref:Small ribosomal subunit protein bS6 n=1 Tax=Candidatus Kaiserbacteria bacterium RIFCSPLOWO2_12_FULL_53_8 TaxID=1798529 RepID=A0A1F6G1G2_9BACT|nr:MAG: 30S ribosomal protein S6 [Candidatus Kaiserbacteria bacterium RIFCSPLOWO2_12_FULL_53_8]